MVALALAGLAGIVSLVLIAFFVGRESARAPPPPVVVAETKAQPNDELAAQASGVALDEAPAPADDFESLFPPELNTEPLPGDPAEDQLPAASRSTDSAPTGPGVGSPGGGDRAVAAYFRELDSVEREAKYWSNPQDLAMTLLGQVTSGDTSGFDQLVVSQRRARDRVRGISPPSPCTDHHRRVLSLMDRGVSLLETVRDAALAGDAGGLMSLPTEAQQLETEARQVDALGEQIRQRFGVAG